MTELKNIQARAGIEIVKYSETKVLTYLGLAIITFLLFIASVFFINFKIERKLANIDNTINAQFADMKLQINSQLQGIAIEVGKMQGLPLLVSSAEAETQ
jgi:hypothetical protein